MADGDGEALTLGLFDQPEAEGEDEHEPQASAAGVPATSAAEGPEEPGPEPQVWTVSQVNGAVRELLEGELKPLWVSGEVGGWTRARSGHCYFTLKDDRAQLRCVMWRNDAARLPTHPDEGMEVRVFGRLTLYEARGEYQLAARKVEAAGSDGLWKLAFERLRKKLEAEGLLAPERKRPLPRFPDCVGVVTSATGAALRDILTVVRRRAPWTRVVVRGCRVQGEGAADEIAEAIRALVRSGLPDVLVVGRGGGSIEDLWAFNEEAVARAVAASPIPVISAVGHEVDVTISDLVADHRAPTPSAAAEAAVQDGATLLEGLRVLPPRLVRALRTAVVRRREMVGTGRERLARAVADGVSRRREVAADGRRRLEACFRAGLERRRGSLETLGAKLEALSPLATLKRGYAVPLSAGEGRLLRGVGDFVQGEPFDLRVADGRVQARTESTRTDRAGRRGGGP